MLEDERKTPHSEAAELIGILNHLYLFSPNRQEKNIITQPAHDVSGAARCSQKEKKCIFKVKTNK